ncbi:hypothetical protein [Micromonospora marina]|uniref:hypothetical protein n=1 Tax=Micromonospora marina TaxID=307120 RepID=UPI003453B580
MTVEEVTIEALNAWRLADLDALSDALARLRDRGWDQAFPTIHGMFAIMVDRRWQAPVALQELVAFVRSLGRQLPAQVHFQPLLQILNGQVRPMWFV